MLPEPIKKFIDFFSDLPSIGPRQATRLAFFLINQGKNFITNLSGAVAGLANIKLCAECFFVHQNKGELCNICSNDKRDSEIVAIIEKESELLSLEKTGKFNGRYFIIGELKKDGILSDAQKMKLDYLKRRRPEGIKETIIATNPTIYGDLSAHAIEMELRGWAKKITRLGRGLPTGGELEFSDPDTLGAAVENRK